MDNKKIFQWPLGVATYRKFPRDIDLLEAFAPDEFHGPGKNGHRKNLCNLQATVRGCCMTDRMAVREMCHRSPSLFAQIYPGSSREELMKVIKSNKLHEVCDIRVCFSSNDLCVCVCVCVCHVSSQARKEWLPEEPDPEGYRMTLLDSDYTLAPVGFNTE